IGEGAHARSGYHALYLTTADSANPAGGVSSLASLMTVSNKIGRDNTSIGRGALSSTTAGNFNIALGSTAGQLLTAGDNNIYIGNDNAGGGGFYSESDTIRIGSPNGVLLPAHIRTFIAGIYGVQLNITGGPFHLTNFPVPVM